MSKDGIITHVLFIINIFFTVLLLLTPHLTFAQETLTNNLQNYENPYYRIKLQYPLNWTKIEPNHISTPSNLGLIVMFKPVHTSSTNSSSEALVIQTYRGPLPLTKYISINLYNLSRSELHFHLIYKNTTTLIGTQAYQVAFAYQTPLSNIKELKTYLSNGPNIYIITYIADITRYDYFLPMILEVIKSIQIAK